MFRSRATSLGLLVLGIVAFGVVAGIAAYLALKNIKAPVAQALTGGRAVRIVGQAMAPTLQDGQLVVFDTTAYKRQSPKRGDIVLFKPANESARLFVMRIIAVPEDRLRINNGAVYTKGQVISEPYLAEPWTFNNSWPATGQDQLLPPGDYFVMGDNRNHSSDSRTFGFVEGRSIQGRLKS